MLAWTSRVAGEAATTVVVVVGGDVVAGRALELLLRGSGYDARFEALRNFGTRRGLREAGLILLAPGLEEWERGMILASARAPGRDGHPALAELVPAAVSRPEQGHVLIPWPCRTEDLERALEDALRRAVDLAG